MVQTERADFQRLLFRTAFCVMACDGEIEDREVGEIRSMNEHAAYFNGVDLTDELDSLLGDLKEKGRLIVDDLFNSFESIELSTVQELLVLEVAFRVANADERTDENEVKLIRILRSKLRLHDPTILDRFGPVGYLFDPEYASNAISQEIDLEYSSSFAMPDTKQLARLNFRIDPGE